MNLQPMRQVGCITSRLETSRIMDRQHLSQAISDIVQAAKPKITNRKPGYVVYDFSKPVGLRPTKRKVS